jgi:YHS domain-containing protein
MLSWALRILLVILVIRFVWRLVQAAIQAASGSPPRTAVPRRGERLVRDPVCGVFIAPSRAISSGSGRATKYFCSERCRIEYEAR